MKITFNGKITPAIIESMLREQDEKKKKIIAFCEQNKESIQYKDSELEFEYHFPDVGKMVEKQKVETRPKMTAGKEVRNAKG